MDVLLSYSNRADRVDALADVMARVQAAQETETAAPAPVPPASDRPAAQTHSLAAQTHGLADDQVRTIFACYRAGVGPRELAGRYGVTERAIKYLLKKHGVQRVRGGGELLGGRP